MIDDELRELIDDEDILRMIDGAIVEISGCEDRKIIKLVTPGYEDYTVLIQRDMGYGTVTEISVDFLEGVLKWDTEDGGTKKKTPRRVFTLRKTPIPIGYGTQYKLLRKTQ